MRCSINKTGFGGIFIVETRYKLVMLHYKRY